MAKHAPAAVVAGSQAWMERLLRTAISSRSGGDVAQLGHGLAARVEDCLALIEATDRIHVMDQALLQERRLRQRVAVLLIARWLASGERATPEELEWIGKLGEYSAARGSGLATSIEGYYRWRDATIAILREEASKRSVVSTVLEPALETVRLSCDATLKGMAASFDAHRLEQARLLQESERRIRTIFTTMPCGGYLVGIDGRITFANEAASELLGLTAGELIGTHVRTLSNRLTTEEGIQPSIPLSELVLKTGEAQVGGQLKTTDASGAERWIQIHAAPLRDSEGEIDAILTVFMDITGVREAAEARRESEAKSRFLSAMSHELRTPLNSILGFAQLLGLEATGPLNDRQRRYVDNIATGGINLLGLVTDVLDVAKARAGELSVNIEPVALADIATAVTDALAHLAGAKGVELRCRVGHKLVVLGDSKRLEQVLSNLVMNAIKFTDEGSISIAARNRGGLVAVTVTDTGVGIPADHLGLVFEEFVQVNTGSARRYDGTGLGLPLAQRLVHLMGGSLTLRSTVGKGTTAQFSLRAG